MKRNLVFAAALLAAISSSAEGPADPSPSAASSASSSSGGLTLKQAFELATQHSEALDIQGENIEQAKDQYRQARSAALPNLLFNVTDTIQDTSGTGSGGSGVQSTLTQRERAQSAFVLKQPLFHGFKELAAMSALKSTEDQQRFLFQRQATLLYQDVTTTFYNVVALETQLSDLQSLMRVSQNRINDLRQRTNLGKSRNSEVVSAESQLATYKAQEAALRGNVTAARERLSYLIGRELGTTPVVDELSDPTDVPALDDMISRSHDRSDIAAIRAEVEARKAGIRVAEADYSPTLDLTADYYTKRPGFQKDIKWDAIFDINVPIYQGGGAKALALLAKSQLRQTQRALDQLIRVTESDVRTAHALLTSSIEETRLSDDAAGKARHAYELLDKEYRLGLSNNLDVINAMNNFETAKRDFDVARVQSKVDLLNLRLAIEMAPVENAVSPTPPAP